MEDHNSWLVGELTEDAIVAVFVPLEPGSLDPDSLIEPQIGIAVEDGRRQYRRRWLGLVDLAGNEDEDGQCSQRNSNRERVLHGNLKKEAMLQESGR